MDNGSDLCIVDSTFMSGVDRDRSELVRLQQKMKTLRRLIPQLRSESSCLVCRTAANVIAWG